MRRPRQPWKEDHDYLREELIGFKQRQVARTQQFCDFLYVPREVTEWFGLRLFDEVLDDFLLILRLLYTIDSPRKSHVFRGGRRSWVIEVLS